MSVPKIVIVGGGSNAWVPNIVKDMMLTEALSQAHFVLYDIDKKASDLTKAFLDKLAKQHSIKPRIVSTDNRARALAGARYVVITIATGGLEAMAQDLAIPEDYGIYHTVGDTVGPGGWARTVRNVDVFVGLARAINRYAPGAVVLNYTNPMTTLTDVLSRLCRGPVVGLCHGLFENIKFLQNIYRIKDAKDLAIKYAGLNHFFWITEARYRGRDLIADLRRRTKRMSLTDLYPKELKDAMGHSSKRELATDLFRLTEVMPYLGDRHTCECFPCYITSKSNMKKYLLKRTSAAGRKQAKKARGAELRRMIRGKIDDELYFRRSRETAADIISAHSQAGMFIDVGNTPNTGQVSNLPAGTVVETPVVVDGNGITPVNFGPLPEIVLGFVAPLARCFTMTVDACLEKSRDKALQALRLDPLCSHLNTPQVTEMGKRLLRAHKKFISWL